MARKDKGSKECPNQGMRMASDGAQGTQDARFALAIEAVLMFASFCCLRA